MKVSLKNVGMLDEAEFEVGGLTLICGENNTGKTYATYSLYGYLDFIKKYNPNFLDSSLTKVLPNTLASNVDNMTLTELKDIVNNVLKKIQKEYLADMHNVFASKKSDFEKSVIDDDLSLVEQLDDSHLDRFNIDMARLKFQWKHDLSQNPLLFLAPLYTIRLCYPLPFILSAERTGASMFYKELDVNKNEMIDILSKTDGRDIEDVTLSLLGRRYSRYPSPVKDNIYFVRDLENIAKRTSFICDEKDSGIHKKIVELLSAVVGGKYIISQDGVEFAPGARQRVTRGKIPIQKASSSVRSLLMLNYYILNVASKNDILMIDEPELNLHPKNQILIARLFALLVNAGVKVFITTHSDYIVRELSNCIMLNNLSQEQIDFVNKENKLKDKYTKNMGLEAGKVKAYLAHNIRGKNTLKSVDITQNQGIFMETFDNPINTQNENQGAIFEEVLRAQNGNK